MRAQLSLALAEPPKRKRAGRKRRSSAGRPKVPHRARPYHDKHAPVHVTLRVRPGLPSLRGYALGAVIGRALRVAAHGASRRQAARRATFRVVHFSIQPNHLHLVVEATSKTALSRGMQGLASGLARRVNRRIGRRGSLFAERYHAHELRSPHEVRHSIVYVLKNFEKHPEPIPDLGTAPVDGIDPCSSARWFSGWAQPPPRPPTPPPVAEPRTWLLSAGWRKGGGPIGRDERPAGVGLNRARR
jgi:REP element-mobilizing transposase RayT